MSGGIAYVLDDEDTFISKFNSEMCDIEKISINSEDEQILFGLIKKHKLETGSTLAEKIITNWGDYLDKFKKVLPKAYARALKELNKKHTVKVTLDG